MYVCNNKYVSDITEHEGIYAELQKIIWKICVLYFEHIHCQCITQGVEVFCLLLLTTSGDG
jgi:hypothetical protein